MLPYRWFMSHSATNLSNSVGNSTIIQDWIPNRQSFSNFTCQHFGFMVWLSCPSRNSSLATQPCWTNTGCSASSGYHPTSGHFLHRNSIRQLSLAVPLPAEKLRYLLDWSLTRAEGQIEQAGNCVPYSSCCPIHRQRYFILLGTVWAS